MFLLFNENKTEKEGNAIVGTMDLYFGCRRAKHDNLYVDERTQAVANGALTADYTATSRDADVPKVHTSIKLNKQYMPSFLTCTKL